MDVAGVEEICESYTNWLVGEVKYRNEAWSTVGP